MIDVIPFPLRFGYYFRKQKWFAVILGVSIGPQVKTRREHQLIALLFTAGILWATPIAAQPSGPSIQGRGRVIYEQNCAVCHGRDGRADTPVSQLLTPRPRDFTDRIDMGRLSVDRIYRAIKEGRPGTAMAAWSQVLTELEIGDVIDYVQSFASAGTAAPLSAQKLSFEIGRRIYANDCASCHGESGKANTEAAKVLMPPPNNFTDPVKMARLDDGRLSVATVRGKPGTAMGGWGGLLSPTEIIALMRYIRTLADPLPAGMRPGELDFLVGKEIYQSYCVACHGEQGNGQTVLGRQLVPHPRDFTSPAEMTSKDDQQLAQSIRRGVHGTAMAPWEGVLNKEDVRRVIVFIRESFTPGRSAPPQKSQ